MNYIQICFQKTSAEQNELLTALLANAGFEGFEEEDEQLKAFIKEEEFVQADLDEIINTIPLQYQQKLIAQQNWNAQWESSFEPVIVDDFAAVRASFHQPITNVKHEIIITPKMSFGTGHHATTFLVMQQMSKLDFNEKSVFDFGTGTGLLAILSYKMGATIIDAIDNDEWSIDNAKENIQANNCTDISIALANSIDTAKQYDIVLANINLNVLTASAGSIAKICKPNATIILSGFFGTDVPQMQAALTMHNISIINQLQKGDWVCLRCIYSA
ncbi:MAG: 50S ribosomal protein L11 methyltransferase [Chitinophagaceae bacterium]|nr:50S ribosomal protein L11 methyltransferase [Chitinophagaceae bacterium]